MAQVGDEPAPLVVSTGSNAIKTDWWRPQTLFAFGGLDIAGQTSPHSGSNGGGGGLQARTELWYRVIEDVDPERKRAKCYKIDMVDSNRDGTAEIRAASSDGRLHCLDEHEIEFRADLGDQFPKDFLGMASPPLIELPLR